MNTKSTRRHLFRKSGCCAYCGEAFRTEREMTIDHIRPRSKGGTNHISNLALACRDCNQRKGNSIISGRLVP